MQLDLFRLNYDGDEVDEDIPHHHCRTCRELLPVTYYQVREDRSNYRAKDCKKCTSKEAAVKNIIRKHAPPRPSRCDCCKKDMEHHEFYLDHCHDEKIFRGWLCNTCNSGIGILGDTLESLETAINYLKAHHERTRFSKQAYTYTPQDNL